ncbi:MAG: serine/threonine-protein phosphatase, partial [Candidatus Magnetominusculus sp. LBB02]|nr:serine/threonine-protein phosphatase [Candidatus Magnetominusculus sp. LBB02]
TDGVTEAMDRQNRLFDEDRLEAVLRENHGRASREMTENVISTLEQFTAGADQSDDITVLCFSYMPKKA